MINNLNMTEKPQKQQINEEHNQEKSPDEVSGFYFSSAIKIFDPNTDEVLVQKRGDI